MCRVLKLDISSTEKLVLMAMADHAHKDGTGCYASVDTLATETSLTRRAVQLTIDKLEERGLIVALGKVRGGRRVATSEFGRGVTMEYQIMLPDHPEAKQTGKPKGRTTFTLSSTGKGESRSQKGRTTFARKGELRSPESKTLNQVQNQQLKTSDVTHTSHHHQSSHNTPTQNADDDDERVCSPNSKQVIPENPEARIRRFIESAAAKIKRKYGDRFSETLICETLDEIERRAKRAQSPPNSENFFTSAFDREIPKLEIEVLIEKEQQRESQTLTPDTSPPNNPSPENAVIDENAVRLVFESDIKPRHRINASQNTLARAWDRAQRKVVEFENHTGEFQSKEKRQEFAQHLHTLHDEEKARAEKRARTNERNRERYKQKAKR
jgi:biotin operon repressor